MANDLYNEQDEDVILTGEEEQKSTEIAKCPSCGADMVFSPETQTLLCEHCGTAVNFQSTGSEEQSISNLMQSADTWANETHVFRCNNCGAVEVLTREEIAVSCTFCGATNIVETSELSGIKPNAIVPFKISKDNAAEKVRIWAKKRFFAPNAFKRSATPEGMRGNYNPAFTFDSKTTSIYSGRLGKRYTTTKRVNGKTQTVTKIRYFNIKGTYSYFFDDILIQASTNIKQKTIDKLSPFATNSSSAYSKEYLSGFVASQYTKDGNTCWQEARSVIDARLRKLILSQYSYDVVQSLSIKTQCSNVTYKYILLPIYVGFCNFRQKVYNFFVNGFSGRVTGKAPVSPIKVLITVGVGLIAAAGALLGLYLLSK